MKWTTNMAFIIPSNIRTTDLIFIVIFTMFQPIYPLAFFRCFISNMGVHTESWTEPYIWTTRVDCSISVNHDRVQVLIPYPLHHVSLLDNKDEVNSPNILSNNNYQVSTQKFWQITWLYPGFKCGSLIPFPIITGW